jgi:hypothetical protein
MNQPFEDTQLDHSLKELDSHFMWKKKRKQELKNRILTNIENLEGKDSSVNHITVPATKRVKRFVVLLVASLLLVFSAGVAAARIPSFNNLVAQLSPEIALLLQPVEISSENNGIKMEIVAAMNDNEMAVIYVTLQDITGNRIDETLDLYDYSISGTHMFNSQMVDYDETKKTATLRIQGNGGEHLNNDKVNFRVKSFLSDKHTNKFEVKANNSEIRNKTPQTVPLDMKNISGGSGKLFQKLEDQGTVQVLKPDEMEMTFPEIKFMHISNIGIIDHYLHIQTKWHKDNIDDHGYFYFVDDLGNEIHPSSINFGTNETGQTKYGNEYTEYIFEKDRVDIEEQELLGHFVSNGKYTTGNWNTTFKMKSVQDEINSEWKMNFGTWKSNRVSVSPLGVTLYGEGELSDSKNIDVRAKMADGSVQTLDSMMNYSDKKGITVKFLSSLPLQMSKVKAIIVNGRELELK